MSEYRYKPTTWIGGKTIGTADVMNNIEDGIAKAHERIDNLGDISSGGGEFSTDYGVLTGVQVIPPIGINSKTTYITYKRKNATTGAFSIDFNVTSSTINLNNYYFKNDIVGWDFRDSTYFSTPAGASISDVEEVCTNNQTVYETLKNYGYNAILINDDYLIHIQQIRGSSDSISDYNGTNGQIVVNTDDNTIHVMDGVTKGGTKLATSEELNEVKEMLSNLTPNAEVYNYNFLSDLRKPLKNHYTYNENLLEIDKGINFKEYVEFEQIDSVDNYKILSLELSDLSEFEVVEGSDIKIDE